jgi:hypothetical protein
MGMIAIHYCLYNRLHIDWNSINKITSTFLQLAGGIIVIYSLNENLGIINRGSLLSEFKNYLKSNPLRIKAVSLEVSSGSHIVIGGEASLCIKRGCNTIEEKLVDLERQIDECWQMAKDIEKSILIKMGNQKRELIKHISRIERDIKDVKNVLDESILSNIKPQIFGFLLICYGSVLNII